MSLYGALFSGVSGIKSQGSKIGIISDNISNVNTIGYKQASALFETLVVNSSAQVAYNPGGVIGGNRQLVDQQGLLIATNSPTDIALSGKGMFVVNAASDGGDQPLFTRAGSFRQDNLGNFVNAAGYFLQGWPLDGSGRLPGEPGNLNTISSANLDSLETVNVSSASGVASATTAVSIGANLDAGEDIYPGEGETITMDVLSAINYGITAEDIIAPDETFGIATTNNIARGDQFTVSTGAGLSYDYMYGGFSVGRDVTTSVAANVGDGGNVIAATALTGGEIDTDGLTNTVTVTLANHGLQTGDSVTIAGFTFVGADTIPLAQINTSHTITRISANQFSFTTVALSTAVDTNPAGGTIDLRQFAGNILDASNATQTFLGATGTTAYTTAARTFTITTPTTGTVTFTYTATSPNSLTGQFNNLNTLAEAIDDVVGLTARVVSGRLLVGAEDANESVTFANGDAVGTATLKGIDWVTELDLSNVATGTRRFSTLQGLSNLVNNDPGVSATVTDPLSSATVEIVVDDPLDTIQFEDYLQSPAVSLGANPVDTLAGGISPTVRITDAGHGLAVGQSIVLSGLAAFDNFTAAELAGTFTITAVTANTYDVVITSALAITAAQVGGGAAGQRQATNTGSLLAEFGMVTSLNGGAYVRGDTGILGPQYDASGATGDNMASEDITAQFSRNMRVFDALGAGHEIRFSTIKIAENTWAVELHVIPETDISTTLVDGQIATGNIEFNGDGTLRSVDSSLTNAITISWTNGAVPSEITFDWGTQGQPIGTVGAINIGDTDGLSQFDANYNVRFVNQDGAPVGELIGVEIDEDGVVIANFSNGETQSLFKLPVADFANVNGLNPITGNVYSQTRASGEVNLREAGSNGTGAVVASTLEQSNVELAEQLTDMIVAQRAYQSNTRVITVTDDLLEELNRL